MLSDRRHPCFRNFDSVASIDVIRMKSYLDNLFDPTCVSVRVGCVSVRLIDQSRLSLSSKLRKRTVLLSV